MLVVSLGGIVGISQGVVVPVGQAVPLTVQLSTPAPIGGTTVMLASSDPTILAVPPSVFIGANSSSVQVYRQRGLPRGR